ncbi:MAG: ABC transporter permease [Planctomycetes bacterium]|nr:ABC transporter permease [Planctomycetota bacterium]
MRAVDLIDLAWTGLKRNRLRTSLTSLGVTVGVFALTTIVAIGGGLETSIRKELSDGENPLRVVVRPGFGKVQRGTLEVEGVTDPAKIDRLRKSMTKRRRGGPGQMRRSQLTLDVVAALSSRSHVVSVRPLAIDRFKIVFGEHELDGALSYGLVPGDERWNLRVIHGAKVGEKPRGVWLHEYLLYRWGYRTDAEQATVVGKEIVLSRPREAANIAASLSTARALGFDINLDSEKAEKLLARFRAAMGGTASVTTRTKLEMRVPIAGVIRERIESDGFDVWEDSLSTQTDMFLTQAFAEELFCQVPSNVTRGYNAVMIEIDEIANVRPTEKAIKHEGFQTVSIGTILERVSQATALITAVVGGLTAIALLVAMLGIVNTMVMNVTERTREIGVLKAVGATDRQVRALFLVESAMIGLVGGVVGVGLSLLASIPGDIYTRQVIFKVSRYNFDGSLFDYDPSFLVLAVVFAVALSVLAALAPSTRASKIDPVRALRDE